jgi:hypothetical protein
VAKPFLISWAANEVVAYIKNNAKISPEGLYELTEGILEEARVSHRKKKEEAGQKGTGVHFIAETRIKEAIMNTSGFIDGHLVNEEKQISNFVDWAMKNNIKFLESEKRLYSEKYWIAGTCDFICEIDGKVWVGDIKTSNAIWPENFWQCAGYGLMIKELKLYSIAGSIIVNLRKDGTFEEKRNISNEENEQAFLSCLNIYRTLEKIKGQIIG